MAVKEGIKIDRRVTIAMDALTASQKKALEPVLRDREGFLANASRQAKAIKVGKMLEDQSAALSWLSTRPEVDERRIGTFGMSLGCTLSYWLAAADERIAAVAQLCCFADYDTLIELSAHDTHGIYLTVPGLLDQFTTGEIGGLVAGVGQRILSSVSKHLIGRFFVALRKEFEAPIGGAAG